MRSRVPLAIVLLAALLFGVAFAQDTSPPAADFLQEVLLPALLTLAGAAVTYLAGWLAAWVKRLASTQQNELVKRVLELVGTTAATAVANVAQVAVNDLKAAAEDGRLTREEARAALDKAVEQVWAAIGQAARDALLGAVGGSETRAIETFIKPAVEAEVNALGMIGPAAKPIESAVDRDRVARLARSRLNLQ